MKRYNKILVGMDGSTQSELALDQAIDLAQRHDASILLVTVQNDTQFGPVMAGGAGMSAPIMAEEKHRIDDRVKELMRGYVQRVIAAGVPVDSKLYYGNSKTELAKEIPEKENIDLIVMGSTGLNRLERVLIGSNTTYVVANAKCDVLVVRDPDDN
ncbi:nucleotide-binding protein [Secundilactobacillus oryzae JCM 18671]|uniref:Universal stress protein n=1 Tax=Secundilactobacillus oryzae JCM 18671 TaxID=1291743 RepID=A0A081BGI0_9LACO|nr:universal stress protein [Secundilactobacillus oryzae]GAK47148.1 nucleotide-binding protein [Secundilactobacillus oryzae JCM 18671]